MAASTNLGPWGSKVHFTGSSTLDVETGGIIAYPVYGATSANITAGSTLPFNDGIVFILRAGATTSYALTVPPPVPGCHLDIVIDQVSVAGNPMDIDLGSGVGVDWGTTSCRFILISSAYTSGPASLELLGLTTAIWVANGVTPSSGITFSLTS